MDESRREELLAIAARAIAEIAGIEMEDGEVPELSVAAIATRAEARRIKPFFEEFSGPGAPKLDFVFTVCDNAANEVCPIWPGQPMSAHWGVPDPAAAEGTDAEKAFAFDEAYRMLFQRVSIFVNLPFDSLSKLSLQEHLDRIGKSGASASKEPA